jgi:hypothetical protein
LSDLANSCEYLSIDKTCTLLTDNPKAKAFRQLKCENRQNITSCCYLCALRLKCATSCKYLGQSENSSELRHVPENTCTDDDVEEFKGDTSQFESVPVAFCFSCNVEMAWAKTQFTIDKWRGATLNMLACDKVLPVTVLLCPKCGKIEFKADIITKKGVI